MMIISNICVILDILSVFAIYYQRFVPKILVDIICKLYLVFLITIVFSGLVYILCDLHTNDKLFVRSRRKYGYFWGISVLLMLVLPIEYTYQENSSVVYSHGPSTIAAYVSFLIIFICTNIEMVIGRDKIHPRRIRSMITWLSVWVLAAVIQFFDRSLLVVTFAAILGVMIIFMMIENPESNLDRDTGFYNLSTMTRYITEQYGNNRTFSMFFIPLNQNDHLSMDVIRENRKDNYIFMGGGDIYWIFKKKEDMDKVLNKLVQVQGCSAVYVVPDSSVVDSAMELLYIVKNAQKVSSVEQNDLIVIDDELRERMRERRETENMIVDAIDNNRVEVFYQPIYSTEEDCFCSAEALVRIRDDNGDIVPPGKFIPVAESEGTIIELGKVIFEKVCNFLADYIPDNAQFQYVEVNLSVVQGQDNNLARDVLRIMREYNINANNINLEITESATIKGQYQLLKNIEELMTHGIEFSLDDFGTGRSNLDYIASMPVQIVKFDRCMIQGYFTSEKTRHIMDAAINMIHGMGLKIVAEGIETEEQFECMKERGIEFIQGYYFSKPLPEKEFVEFMQNRC